MSIVENRKAFHDYFIEERYEAGIALEGWEVKAIRGGRSSIAEAYVMVRGAELFLIGAHITRSTCISTRGGSSSRSASVAASSSTTSARRRRKRSGTARNSGCYAAADFFVAGASASAVQVDTTVSGLSDMLSIPCSISQRARSG
jgi:hypothetical protein